MKEIWKPVLGYEGLYEACNIGGKIRSLNYNKTGKIMILSTCHSGKYDQIHLYKESNVKCYLVHRLVWEAFNGPIPEGMQVNHIDENKRNNNLDNLNLMTPMENVNWGTGIERRWATRQNTDNSKELDNRRKYMKEYLKKICP